MDRATSRLFYLDGHSHTLANGEASRDCRIQTVLLSNLLAVIVCCAFSFIGPHSIRSISLK